MNPTASILLKNTQLPSIPKVVRDAIQTLQSEGANLHGLIAEIKHDPSLSARILRLANSGLYARSRQIGSIDEAVVLIGTAALRSLVIASGISGAFVKVAGIDLNRFWHHAILSANIARMLARHASANPEAAYTAGLMHRIGQLMLHTAFPSAAQDLVRESGQLTGLERARAERHKMQTDHCEVGAELARQWNFPDDIVAALEHYATPSEPQAPHLARLVGLASIIATRIDTGTTPEVIAEEVGSAVAELCELDRTSLLSEIRGCAASAEESACLS